MPLTLRTYTENLAICKELEEIGLRTLEFLSS